MLDKIEYTGEDEALSADRAAFMVSAHSGLSKAQKTLECKYLYDGAGSELFDQICDLPEYYPTRTEIGILEDNQGAIAASLGKGVEIIELGSGASVKTRILLSALNTPRRYVPVDISEDFVLQVAAGLRADYPGLAVEPVVADFMAPFQLPEKTGATRLLFFPGSTIGNLHRADAASFLNSLKEKTGADKFLIGVDLKKDKSVLEAAYDDAAGVTANFNLNMLRRINRELRGTFDLTKFKHRAIYNEGEGRVEMHMVSLCAQSVRVAGRGFTFREGETIHSENSYKYGLGEFAKMVAAAGWDTQHVWTDDEDLFAVFLLVAE